MNKKALEAFKSLMERLSNNVTLSEWELCNKDMQTVEDFIEKALTPPTEEEVCKALSEFLETTVRYVEKMKWFSERKRTLVWLQPNGNISVIVLLPSHLIDLIGRFYEGVEYE